VYLHQEVQICHRHGYHRAISLLRPHDVVGLRQAITELAKTVTILQEPLNFGDFKHTHTQTKSHLIQKEILWNASYYTTKQVGQNSLR